MNVDEIKELKNAFIECFGTKAGRKVLNHLELMGFIHTSTHVPGDSDSTSVNEGNRQMVLHIKSMIELPPDRLEEIIKAHGMSES